MAIEIVMPRLGWTMEEGIFGGWLKQDGDAVAVGDLLFTVETDKATQEIEAFAEGILRIPLRAPQVGDVVRVGHVIGYLTQADESISFETAQPRIAPAATPFIRSVRSGEDAAPTRHDGLPAISPRARRVAVELGVEWAQLQGSGRTGRIVERDVRAAAVAQPATARLRISPLAQHMADEGGVDLAARTSAMAGAEIGSADTVPVSPIRRLIAQRMLNSAHTTAAVTLTTEADATDLVALREQFKKALEPRGLAAPSYNDLLIKLTATALQEHRLLNAIWREQDILVHDDIHIGLAVDTKEGLLVPVVRNVQSKSLRQISVETTRLIEDALTHRLSATELQGGTFTITNLGMYGIDAFTPIIQMPQCAILGVGRIAVKPWVVDGQVVPRQIMALSLTFDHRIVDGGPAARFLNTVREYVEMPALWLAA